VWRRAVVQGEESGRPVASSSVTQWLSGIIAHHRSQNNHQAEVALTPELRRISAMLDAFLKRVAG